MDNKYFSDIYNDFFSSLHASSCWLCAREVSSSLGPDFKDETVILALSSLLFSLFKDETTYWTVVFSKIYLSLHGGEE